MEENMNKRTWPYGTKKNGTVIQASRVQGGFNLLFMESGENKTEGFFLVFDRNHAEAGNAKPGDKGIITFTKGGQTGGYWDYKAAA
jgi:hypothetical protein